MFINYNLSLTTCLSSQGVLCDFCVLDYFNPNYNNEAFPEELCQPKNNASITLFRNILIMKSNDYEKISNNTFFDMIYFSMSIAFAKENNIIAPYYNSKLYIYFSKGTHYYINDNQQIDSFFRRTLVDLTISPLYCDEESGSYFSNLCIDKENPNFTLVLKSRFILYVSYQLKFIGMNIDASDILLPIYTNSFNNNTISICRVSETICCINDYFDNIYDENNEKLEFLCGLRGRPLIYSNENKIGIFNIEIIYDVDINNIFLPFLKIKDTKINNIFLVNNDVTQVISIQAVACNIFVENMQINNVFTSDGIVYSYKDTDYIDFYKNAEYISNYKNEELAQIFIKQGFCKFINIYIGNTLDYAFSNYMIKNIIFFNLEAWKSTVIFSAYFLSNFINEMGLNIILFSFANNQNLIEITNLNISNFFEIQIISSSFTSINIENLSLSQINIKFYDLFDFISSTCYFRNVILKQINNQFQCFLFVFSQSIANFTNISFYAVQGVSLKFSMFQMPVNIRNITFENCIGIKGNSFLFEQSSTYIEGIYFTNFTTDSQIFSSIYSNETIIKYGKFININVKNFILPVFLSYFFLSDCVFNSEILIKYLIAINSQLMAIYFINNIFVNYTGILFFYGISNLIYCNFSTNYFFNITWFIDAPLQLYQGSWMMNYTIFERINVIAHKINTVLMDIELALTYIINSSIMFLTVPADYNRAIPFYMIYFWQDSEILIDSSNFIIEKEGFPYGFFLSEDAKKSLTISNNNFIQMNILKNHSGVAFFASGTPKIIIKSCYFANFACQNLSDIRAFVGVMAIHGVSSFYKVNNEFALYVISNTFINCACYYGGSIGILNYNTTYINNTKFINTTAKNGGLLYTANCPFLYLDNLTVINSSAKSGSSIFSITSNLILINDCKFNITRGEDTGTIHVQDVKYVHINNSIFFDMASSKGSFLLLFASQCYIYKSYVMNGSSRLYGGMIYLNGPSNLTLDNFYSNYSLSDINGGFLYAESSYSINIYKTIIENSFSNGDGGCLFINEVIDFHMDDVKLINSETYINGIIFISNIQASIVNKITSLICINNKAQEGSFIFYASPGDLELDNITCVNQQGTLIILQYTYEINVILKNAEFKDNEMLFKIYSVNLILENIILENNSIGYDSYSLFYIEQAKIKLINVTFFHPVKAFYTKSTNAFIESEIIDGLNTEISMKYVFFQGYDIITISNDSLFANCHNCSLSFFECLLKNNIFQENGLIVIKDSTINIENSIFSNNTGPIFVIYNSPVVITKCFFIENFNFDDFNPITDFDIEEMTSLSNFITRFYCQESIFYVKNGFSLYFHSIDIIDVKNTTFLGDTSNLSQMIILSNCHSFSVNSSFFLFSISDYGSSIRMISDQAIAALIAINNSQFIMCESYIGGVIYLQGHYILYLEGNIFLNNKAIDYYEISIGGVLVLLEEFYNASNFILFNNLFINNSADIASIIYSDVYVQCINNTFINNIDSFNMTNEIISAPFQFQLIKYRSENQVIYENFTSEMNFTISSGLSFLLAYEIIDAFNHKITYDNFSSSYIKSAVISRDNPLIKIENYINISYKGEFDLEKLVLYGLPDSNFEVIMIVNLNDPFKNLYQINKSLIFYSRKCVIGEIYKINFMCEKCPQNYFSLNDPMENFDKNQLKTCSPCVSNAYCPGGYIIIPNQGYWRKSSTSLKIIACQNSLYCIGIPPQITMDQLINNMSNYESLLNDTLLGYCYYGHEKNICQECIYGYGKFTNKDTCKLCKDYDILIIIRGIGIFIILMIYLTFTSNQMLNKNNTTLFEEVSKIYINHFQKISLIIFLDLTSMLDTLKGFFNILDFLNIVTDDIFSNDCLVQRLINKDNFSKIYFVKVFITLILPIILSFFSFMMIIFIHCLRDLIKKMKVGSKYFSKLLIFFLISIFLFYPLLIKSSFSLLNCVSLDETNDSYLYASPNISCWSVTHYLYFFSFGFTGIILFGIGFPVVIFIIIHKHKQTILKESFNSTITKSLSFIKKDSNIRSDRKIKISKIYHQDSDHNNKNNEDLFRVFHFFYKDYKGNLYFWEIIIFFQKFLLTLIQNLNQLLNMEIRNFLFFIILLIYLFFVMKMKPFKHEFINNLERNSIIIAIFTKFCLILTQNNAIGSSLIMFFMVAQILLNLLFIINVLYILIKYLDWKSFFMTGMLKFQKAKIKFLKFGKNLSKKS